MDKRSIFVLAALFATSVAIAQAYRWVDDDGIVHYSDRPRDGAEEIVLPDANTTTIRRYQQPSTASTQGAESDEDNTGAFRYESFEVSTPTAEETLWNIEGTLNVSLALNPPLQPGHQVRVYFDGEPRLERTVNFTIDEVWRGVHNIQAEVVDEAGRMMIRTRTNRFYVQQSTVQR